MQKKFIILATLTAFGLFGVMADCGCGKNKGNQKAPKQSTVEVAGCPCKDKPKQKEGQHVLILACDDC